MACVQRKEDEGVKHTAEMDECQSQLHQLEGLLVHSSLPPDFTRFPKSCILFRCHGILILFHYFAISGIG